MNKKTAAKILALQMESSEPHRHGTPEYTLWEEVIKTYVQDAQRYVRLHSRGDVGSARGGAERLLGMAESSWTKHICEEFLDLNHGRFVASLREILRPIFESSEAPIAA